MESPLHLSWLLRDPLQQLQKLKLEQLASGRTVFDLSMINPDIEPHRFLVDRLMEAVNKPTQHRYAVSRGVRRLREAFADKYKTQFGVKLDPETEVCVCLGAKEAVQHALVSIAEPGQRVLVGRPSYPAHLAALRLAGLEFDFFEVQADEEAMLGDIIERLSRGSYRVLLLNFPNNPTGVSVGEGFYQRLGAAAADRNTFVLNDFVYGEMLFDGQAPSLLATDSCRSACAEIYSLSKAYCVPGWRVGALAGSNALVRTLGRLKAQTDYGIFLPIQSAAAAALTSGEDLVGPTVDRYRARTTVLQLGLENLGWQVQKPAGGSSVWAQLPSELASRGSLAAAEELLESTGVVPLPGLMFGREYDSYMRFALVLSEEKLHDVVDLLRGYQERKAA